MIHLQLTESQFEGLRMVYGKGRSSLLVESQAILDLLMRGWDVQAPDPSAISPVRVEPESDETPVTFVVSPNGKLTQESEPNKTEFHRKRASEAAKARWQRYRENPPKPRAKKPPSPQKLEAMAKARAAKLAKKNQAKLSPTPIQLGIEKTPGYFKAEVIRMAADGMMAHAIWQVLREHVRSVDEVERAIAHDHERIEMCRTFQGEERRAYLNGIAIGHNKALLDAKLRRVS